MEECIELYRKALIRKLRDKVYGFIDITDKDGDFIVTIENRCGLIFKTTLYGVYKNILFGLTTDDYAILIAKRYRKYLNLQFFR